MNVNKIKTATAMVQRFGDSEIPLGETDGTNLSKQLQDAFLPGEVVVIVRENDYKQLLAAAEELDAIHASVRKEYGCTPAIKTKAMKSVRKTA